MDGNQLWRQFSAVCCSNQELLGHVLSFLPLADLRSLRLGNRHLRQAVSGVVESVLYDFDAATARTDLSTTFPAAKRLLLRMTCTVRDDEEQGISSTAAYLFLQHVVALSPGLLQQLTDLKVDIILDGDWSHHTQSALSSLLSRCTSLQSLQVTWQSWTAHAQDDIPSVAIFAGQGSTPEERCSHMQQQLTSLARSPVLLAPASWPQHLCLVDLNLRHYNPHMGPPFSVLCAGAAATTSLTALTVEAQDTSHLHNCCKALSKLAHLKRLTLYSDADSGSPRGGILDEVARLPALQLLSTDANVLHGSVPASWSRLSGLTMLVLHGCDVQLASLPSLPALHTLELCECTVSGSLVQLSMLPRLTALQSVPVVRRSAAQVDGDQAEGSAAVVLPAWQGNLQHLWWPFSSHDMQAVSQLTALTSLHLGTADVCPEFCWQLAALPNLEDLQLPDALAPPRRNVHVGRHLRASLHALETLDPGTPHSLRELSRWTDVDPGLCLVNVPLSDDVPLAFDQLGAGWLQALLAAPAQASLVLGLGSDTRVQQAVGALQALAAGSKRLEAAVLLGQEVGFEALGHLLEAAHHFPQGSLRVANGTVGDNGLVYVWHTFAYQLGFSVQRRLPAEFFWRLRGVAAPGLRKLLVDCCDEMVDTHVSLIAIAAPALQVLQLHRAARLTDAALFALVGCRQLARVVVTGCLKGVSGRAAAMLLDGLPELALLAVGNADGAEVGQALGLHQPCRWAPMGPGDGWEVADVEAGVVECIRSGRMLEQEQQ